MNAITKKPLTKRIGIFAILAAMILSLCAPMASFADPTVPAGKTTGSITIHKLDQGTATPVPGTGAQTTPPAGAKPLNGITFDYIKVVPEGDPHATGSPLITSNGVKYCKDDSNITGKDKTADLTAAGHGDGAIHWGNLPLGFYLIHESAKNGYTQVNDFIVSIPTTIHGTTKDKLEFDVHVYPKNSDISIGKGAADPNDKDASNGTNLTPSLPGKVGDIVHWFITTRIPSGYAFVAGKTAYSITDSPSKGLKFTGDLEVRVNPSATGANDGTLLVNGTDYTVVPAAGPYTDGGKVTITFTDARLAKFKAGDKLQVKIATEILESAAVGGTTNEADLDYTNSNGDDYTSGTGENSPEIFMGGLSLIKVDGNKSTGLNGAKFKLVEKSSADFDADFAKNGYFKVRNTEVEATSVTKNGNDGYFEFKNLPYGKTGDTAANATPKEYWLVETAAPNGYRLIGAPSAVTINGHSYNDALTLTAGKDQASASQIIKNFPGFEFPLTGGMGTLIFVVGGIVLIGLAGIVIASTRRRGSAQKGVQ
jgi:fimbrial isopeptide formation D2 family protein/LPXTG-motif cell wall-anchored protein